MSRAVAAAGAEPAPTFAALLSTGCGTAVASVCAVGLFAMERLVGGAWSLVAVLLAALLSAALARALSRLVTVLPTGAGLLAFLGRGLGREAALLLVVPYLLLTLVLMGAEATVVGLLLQRALGIPVLVAALAFLLGTWALCRAGLQLSLGAQALSTWALLLGLSVCALHGLWRSPLPLALPPPPSILCLLAAVGQATFLFMGFELITSFGSVAPRQVGAALSGSVVLLALFYGALALGFAGLPAGIDAGPVPQLALAAQAGGRPTLWLITALSLLASFSSFNGALLSLSRLAAALPARGLLAGRWRPGVGGALVPRGALLVLLALACSSALLIHRLQILLPVLGAAAVSAALVYGALLLARERRPFREVGRPLLRRVIGAALAVLYLSLALGVLADAGAARPALLVLLALAYGCGLWLCLASRRGR